MKDKEFAEMYGRYLDVRQIKEKILNIKYGPYERNVLDVYYPDKHESLYPAIVFIHGGGFFKGDKRRYQLKPALSGLKQGYAVISINYRLIQTDELPAAVWDAKAAIRYIRANADKLKIDANKIVVWGESAGATLACLIGLTSDIAELEDLNMGNSYQSTKVKAVVDWYAPIDIKELEKQQCKDGSTFIQNGRSMNMIAFDKDGRKTKEEIYLQMDKMNPLNYLRNQKDGKETLPAFLIEHGEKDKLVPKEQSEELYKSLKECIPEDKLVYRIIENASHGVEDFSGKENLKFIFENLNKWIK